MGRPLQEAQPHFSQPVRQITLMLLVLTLVAMGAYLIFPSVEAVFLANPWLNGVILLVFLIGLLACFWQVAQLISAVNWIEGFAANRPGYEITQAPRLLAPLAALLRSRGAHVQLNATSTRSILESVGSRIEEERDITRYLVNLLIFLGLLGTFFGLATTVPAVVETIRSLAPVEGEDSTAMFARLMTGLEMQMGGMGTAFSSSLLGLSGSLVVGLLELFVSHGQNRFYRELEEWLSSITRLGFASDEGGAVDQVAVAGVLDHMSEQMDTLGRLHEQAESRRMLLDQRIGMLAESVDRLTRRMEGEVGTMAALARLAESQERLLIAMEAREDSNTQMDAESRMRLRSIDVQLLKILEEISAGRQESTLDLRSDLAALSAAIRQLAAGAPPALRG